MLFLQLEREKACQSCMIVMHPSTRTSSLRGFVQSVCLITSGYCHFCLLKENTHKLHNNNRLSSEKGTFGVFSGEASFRLSCVYFVLVFTVIDHRSCSMALFSSVSSSDVGCKNAMPLTKCRIILVQVHTRADCAGAEI